MGKLSLTDTDAVEVPSGGSAVANSNYHYYSTLLTGDTACTTGGGYGEPVAVSSTPYEPQWNINAPTPPKAATGTKYDSAKPDFSLIDPYAQDGLAAVLTFGKIKYGAYNWLKGIAYSRLIAAAERHINAIKRGEDIDPESGHPHVDHAACNLMFLSRFMKTRPELDDRPVENKTDEKVMF